MRITVRELQEGIAFRWMGRPYWKVRDVPYGARVVTQGGLYVFMGATALVTIELPYKRTMA